MELFLFAKSAAGDADVFDVSNMENNSGYILLSLFSCCRTRSLPVPAGAYSVTAVPSIVRVPTSDPDVIVCVNETVDFPAARSYADLTADGVAASDVDVDDVEVDNLTKPYVEVVPAGTVAVVAVPEDGVNVMTYVSSLAAPESENVVSVNTAFAGTSVPTV